jgi:hypothetical protein
MSVEDLPERIKRQIVVDTERDRPREDNRLALTECIGCLRKAWYRRKHPKDLTMQQRWWFYRGNLFDNAWSPLFERNQIRMTYPLKEPPVVIVGRLDFIDDDNAIADWKTVDKLSNIEYYGAKEDNVKQVLFYAWCEKKTKARLYYIGMKDILKIEVEVTKENTDALLKEIEDNAKILYTALTNNVLPERDKKHTDNYWECGLSDEGVAYCEYREECWKKPKRKL